MIINNQIKIHIKMVNISFILVILLVFQLDIFKELKLSFIKRIKLELVYCFILHLKIKLLKKIMKQYKKK